MLEQTSGGTPRSSRGQQHQLDGGELPGVRELTGKEIVEGEDAGGGSAAQLERDFAEGEEGEGGGRGAAVSPSIKVSPIFRFGFKM